jgi:hypothetical protein
MKDRKMQLKAEHAIEDEESAECGEAPSRAQKEHQKAEDKKPLQKVNNSTVPERTSFDFVKIHFMLHYEESVPRIGHIVKDSTETQAMNHPTMCIISKKHFRPGGMAASEWTRSVRAVRDTLVADYFTPSVRTTRRVAYWPPIAISSHSVGLLF